MKLLADLAESFKEWLNGDESLSKSYDSPKEDPIDPPFEILSNYFNVAAYDDVTQFFYLDVENNKGKMEQLGGGFTLEINSLLGANEATMTQLASLFVMLPENAGMQIQIFGSPDIRPFLDAYVQVQSSRPDYDPRKETFVQLAKHRIDFWNRNLQQVMFPDTAVRLRDIRCILSVVLPSIRFDGRGSSLDQAINTKNKIIAHLKSMNMYIRTWSAKDYIAWTEMMFNPAQMFNAKAQKVEPGYNELDPIRDQILNPNTTIKQMDTGKEIRFDSNLETIFARCYSVQKYPKMFELNQMGAIIGEAIIASQNYTSPFLVSLNVFRPDFDAKRQTIQLKNARATQVADSQFGKILPEVHEIKADLDILTEALNDGNGILSLFHQAIVWEKQDAIDDTSSHLENIWNSKGFEIYLDQYLQMESLLCSMPMSLDKYMIKNCNMKKRWTTKTITNGVSLTPVMGEWKGMGAPVLGMFGTRGQCMSFDLFGNTTGNFNAAIIGTSGSGKSFFVNDLIRNYLGSGAKAWIIDVGRSYEKFCNLIGGQYIEFTQESNIVISPFEMIHDIEEDMPVLKLLLSLMISPSGDLNDFQMAKLEEAIMKVWNKHHADPERLQFAINDVRDELINMKKPVTGDPEWDAIRMGEQLLPYTTEGIYGRYFNGPSTLNFQDDLVVLELEELKSKPELQTVVMQLIIYFIMQEMYLSRDRKKIAVIDEAWQLLGGSASVARFIEEGYRRARKYNGSFITATQGLNDYYNNPAAQAALTSSDNIFLMRSKEESILTLEQRKPFEVNESILMKIRALQKNQYYSEMYVYTQNGAGVARLISDPFNALVSSSSADDFEAVNHYIRSGKSVHEAIEAVLADRGICY